MQQRQRVKLLTIPEAAEMLGLKPSSVRAWVFNQTIPFFKIGRAVRLCEADILAVIACGERPAKSER